MEVVQVECVDEDLGKSTISSSCIGKSIICGNLKEV